MSGWTPDQPPELLPLPNDPPPPENDADLPRDDPPLPESASRSRSCMMPRQAAPPLTAQKISNPTPPRPSMTPSQTGVPACGWAPDAPHAAARGSAPASPPSTWMIPLTPPLMPPGTSPALNAGRIRFSMISLVAASVSVPSRP